MCGGQQKTLTRAMGDIWRNWKRLSYAEDFLVALAIEENKDFRNVLKDGSILFYFFQGAFF